MKNKLLSILLTICMVVTLLPVSALADGEVSYLYYADEAAVIAGTTSTGSCTDYTVVSDQTAWGAADTTSWYVVNSTVTISDRITVSGDVRLILANGCTLTASAGIGVASGNSLTIYGQSADESTMGVLKCRSVASYNAAIGGDNSQSSGQITINGGSISVKGSYAAGIGGGYYGSGTVTVNGGIVTADTYQSSSSGCAGIGGGYHGSGTVTINGGTVTATGSAGGAGIGGGGYGAATVTIRGGSVKATGGESGAGIGSGSGSNIDHSYTATVTISGGTVDASTGGGSGYKAAIGCGAYTTGTVTITGGNVTATATYNSVCIGGMPNDTGTNIVVTITGGNVTARPSTSTLTQYQGIGGSNCTVILGWTNETDSITSPKWGGNGSSTVSFAEGKSFQYQDTHSLADAASLREGATLIPFVQAGQLSVDQADVSGVRAWYPHTGNAIEPEPVVTYSGTQLVKDTDYTLTYTDDHTNLGEKTVTITGQGSYTGTKTISYQIVEASTTYLDDAGSSQTCATFQCLDQSDTALSAGWYLVYDDLTINDRVSLTGDVNLILKDGKTLTSVKGISVPSTASLTIYAQSNSEATAGKLLITDPEMFFSGIGNDYKLSDRDSHGNITIVGGVIEAKGGISGAAIGSALSASQGGNIVVKGGFVTANGTGGGAGIGSGANTDGGTVTISGGKVTATSIGGAAIGSGGFGDGKGSFGTINITGGTISAKSESGGAGIGGGSNGAGGTISITGGTVTASASGETGGAGIGGGKNAAGGSITVQNATIARAASYAGAGIGSGGGETTGTTTIIIGTGATVTNAVSEDGAGIGSGKNSSAACSVTIKDGANVTSKSTIGAGIGGGAGASNFSVTIQDNDTTVNAWAGGIGKQDKNGNLSAYGGAAIGGGANTNGGTVIITGGTVTARAIGGGAGIGSGTNTSTSGDTHSGTITISGGTVTATATHRAAGIGGGRRSNGGTITISGGTVTANGSDAAGIGHGGEDTLWEGQGSFYIPIVDDPTQDVGGAWYDNVVQIEGTNKTTSDGVVTFTYADGGTVSITASSYPSSPTLSKEFMYGDTGTAVTAIAIEAGKTIIPYSTHTHSFTYTVSGATITATCGNTDCYLTSNPTLTISAPTGDLTYDGTAKEATVTGEIPGVTTPSIVYKQGDTVLGTAPVNAGTYTASITLGEGNEAKTASVSYTITPKPVTITGLTAANKVYDGTTTATATGTATVDGKVGEDDVTVTAGTAAFANANVGEDKTVTFSGYSLTGAAAGNYTLSAQPTATANITAKPVTVTANAQSVAVGGSISSDADQAELTGAVEGHTLTAVTLTASDTSAVTTTGTITPGAATIKNGETDVTANYAITYTPGVLTVIQTYTVTTPTNLTGGTVTADKATAAAGDTVTLTVTPAEGCALSGLTYTCGETVTNIPPVQGVYSFTMPAGNVTVSATFVMPTDISTWDALQEALTNASQDSGNPTLLRLSGNVTPQNPAECSPLTLESSRYAIIDLNGHTIDRGLTDADAVNDGFVISVAGNLTVQDTSTAQAGKITGGKNVPSLDDYTGGGVVVKTGGSFTMTGGSITGNKVSGYFGGGGVCVQYNGTFEMTGGSISGNTAGGNGGGVCVFGTGKDVYGSGTFKLTGGSISGNTASGSGGGVFMQDSGSIFTMTGGSISGNTATGDGGGVCVAESTFKLSGGSISNNTADNGGGVYVVDGTFEMTGGSITGNSANGDYGGGGVCVTWGTFNLSGAPVITGNVKGGTITNGELTGGTANNVYLPNGSTITVTDTLNNTTPIGVTMADNTGVFTSGLSDNGTAANFVSDNADYRVCLNDGEAELYHPTFYTVSISDAEHGTVTASVDGQTITRAEAGDTVTLTVTPAAGCELTSLTYTCGETVTNIPPVQGVYSFTMPAGNVTVTATWHVAAPVFGPHAMVLSGEIGVKFKVLYPADYDMTGVRVDFAISDGRTGTMTAADAEGNAKWFICYINALELGDTITATLYNGETQLAAEIYSAVNYINAAQSQYPDDQALLELLKSLQDYGHYMQGSGWTDSRSHTAIPAVETLTGADIAAAQEGVSGMGLTKNLGDGIANAKFSLTLNAKTKINISVKPNPGYTITSEGYTVRDIGGETYYQFTSEEIGAGRLGTPITFNIFSTSGPNETTSVATITASPMSYVKASLNNPERSTEKKLAMTSYYRYYWAAVQYQTYLNSQQGG